MKNQCRGVGNVEEIRHLDDFDRLLLHALWPGKLRPLLWFARAEQDLETLLDIVHQIFCGIGIVQEILADDKLDRPLLRSKGEGFGGISCAASIDGRSGRWAVAWSRRTRRSVGGSRMDLIQQSCGKHLCGCDDAAFGGCIDLGDAIRGRSVIKQSRGMKFFFGTLTFLRTSLLIIEISLPKFSPRSLD